MGAVAVVDVEAFVAVDVDFEGVGENVWVEAGGDLDGKYMVSGVFSYYLSSGVDSRNRQTPYHLGML